MGDSTLIVWCDHTFNPWVGCAKVSPGCENCYAAKNRAVSMLRVKWGDSARHVTSDGNWQKPLVWNRNAEKNHTTARVFCGSLCDIADSVAPQEQRDRLFALIRSTPSLRWLLLTKRSQNLHLFPDPLPPNTWIGVTAESQPWLILRADQVGKINAPVRFVSYEPAIGPLDLTKVKPGTIDLVICGCESGPKRRPMELQWARHVREQCRQLGIAFFMKQIEVNGQVTDNIRLFPRDLRIREFPGPRLQ